MGFLVRLIILFIILIFGYWLIAPYVLAPNPPYWAEINSNMPDSFRRFACQEAKKQDATAQIKSCEGY